MWLNNRRRGLASIVFIHGLTGDREKTWTAHNASTPWPGNLLPSVIPDARILTFGYDAYVADWRGEVSQNRVKDHAWKLLTALSNWRGSDGTVSWLFMRPSQGTDYIYSMSDRSFLSAIA
jgi:hypothetical protein